jgi:hypothetical protein
MESHLRKLLGDDEGRAVFELDGEPVVAPAGTSSLPVPA